VLVAHLAVLVAVHLAVLVTVHLSVHPSTRAAA
jgi:hypothetical protein